MSFTLAYCFMQSEISRDHTWEMEQLRAVFQQFGVQPEVFVTDRDLALINALAMVFPHCKNVLCRWHISKNIHAKQRTSFGTQEAFETFMAAWNAVVFAKTEAEFQRKMVVLEDLAPPQVMAYLASTWLMHKEKFVTAWMQGIKHFGHVSTSRVESAHSALKKWIAVSTDNFHVVNAAIRQACSEQLIVARQHNARERAIADMQFGKSFANVMGKVAVAALKLAHQRYKMRTAVTTRCSGQFQSSMGIPCEHSWNAAADRGLQLEDFDPHWWLQARGVVLVPQETVTLASAVSHLQEAYNNEESAHKRRLLLNGMVSLVSSVQLTGVVEPEHIQSRGRPSGSTQRLRHSGFHRHLSMLLILWGLRGVRAGGVVCVTTLDTMHEDAQRPISTLPTAQPISTLPKATNLNTTESNQSQHYRQPISTLPKARPLKPKPKAEE